MATKTRSNELTSIEHGCFDTAALQQELAQALEDDRVYKLTDSMKKRAIHTAANYDEFKNLVACADLKPISQRELRDFSRNERQTSLSYKVEARKEFRRDLQLKASPTALNQPPANTVEFCRNWRRYLKSNDEKLRYLTLTTPTRLGEIFKSDMDADLMAEIIHILVVTWKHGDNVGDEAKGASTEQGAFALDIMKALSQTRRFALLLDFLDNNQLEKIQTQFAMLGRQHESETSKDASRFAALKAKFKI
ncbi:Coiled-coil domain-containing protein, partial [Globisporangium splendens]